MNVEKFIFAKVSLQSKYNFLRNIQYRVFKLYILKKKNSFLTNFIDNIIISYSIIWIFSAYNFKMSKSLSMSHSVDQGFLLLESFFSLINFNYIFWYDFITTNGCLYEMICIFFFSCFKFLILIYTLSKTNIKQ